MFTKESKAHAESPRMRLGVNEIMSIQTGYGEDETMLFHRDGWGTPLADALPQQQVEPVP